MKLANEMRIGRPPAEVFDALLDVERVAGCMPGSKLTGKTAEDTYDGEVKVRVGPLSVAYSGTVRYVEVEREDRRITLKASGKEKSGQGNADAHVVASVLTDGDGSKVSIDTDLMVRGKVAQFGSGVISEVSERLIGQFAGNVEQLLSGQGETATTDSRKSSESGPVPTGTQQALNMQSETEPALDGMSLVVGPMLKRAAPVAISAAVGLLIGMGLRRNAKRGSRRVPESLAHLAPSTAYLLVPIDTFPDV